MSRRGRFAVAQDPRDALALYRDIVLSMRGTLVARGLATDVAIEPLVQELDVARTETVRFGTGALQVEMIAAVPCSR